MGADGNEFGARFGPEILKARKRAGKDDLAERSIEAFADAGIDAKIGIVPNEFVHAFEAADGGCGAAIGPDFVGVRLLEREQLGESGEVISDLSVI